MQVVVVDCAAPTALGRVLRIRAQSLRVGLASFAPRGRSVAHRGAMQVVFVDCAAPLGLGRVLRIRAQPLRVGLTSFAPPGLGVFEFGSGGRCRQMAA
jgi:hypothetical protein